MQKHTLLGNKDGAGFDGATLNDDAGNKLALGLLLLMFCLKSAKVGQKNAKKMTSSTATNTMLGDDEDTAVEEPPKKRIRLTLEPYEEQRINHIEATGQESLIEYVYIFLLFFRAMNDEEHFIYVLNNLDFAAEKYGTVELPTMKKKPPPFPWTKTMDKLQYGIIIIRIHFLKRFACRN